MVPVRRTSGPDRAASPPLPFWLLYGTSFAVVVLSHLPLLRLPAFWDESSYYIPAALRFYRTWALIPPAESLHPPLPNVLLALVWHVFGYSFVATRITVCAVAVLGIVAVVRLAEPFLGRAAAVATALLTAAYPIWFAQSSLAQSDIFSAALCVCGFAVYFPAVAAAPAPERSLLKSPQARFALIFGLAVLAKETSAVQLLALGALELHYLVRKQGPAREHLRWLAAITLATLPLIAWYVGNRVVTGYMFGSSGYFRFNATRNVGLGSFLEAFSHRALHLFWQRNIWVAFVLALACLLLPRRPGAARWPLPKDTLAAIAFVVGCNWLAFSVLGGALLSRYLLTVFPLIFFVIVAVWCQRTAYWPLLSAFTGVAFLTALWINPPWAFAPEDNLTYIHLIAVHRQATHFLETHFPNARVLTATPGEQELTDPDLGYVTHPIRALSIETFNAAEIAKAAAEPGEYDTAFVFTTKYWPPDAIPDIAAHPNTWRGRQYAAIRDLTPPEIARALHGTIVWQGEEGGEWAAVLRFNRSYEARLSPPQGQAAIR